MPKHGKNYKNAVAKVDGANLYSPKEAVTLSKELATAKFDETIEVAIRLGVDTRKADQNVRGSISLPHGTGKSVRVAVFAEGEKAREAEAAGADIVGGDELIAEVEKGMLDFDAAIATPQMMGKVGRLGRVLGPRGLMPNPKLGTVTMDVARWLTSSRLVVLSIVQTVLVSATLQSARLLLRSSSLLRTMAHFSLRSFASSHPALRVSTSRPLLFPLLWALASRLIQPRFVTSWRTKLYA